MDMPGNSRLQIYCQIGNFTNVSQATTAGNYLTLEISRYEVAICITARGNLMQVQNLYSIIATISD
jgi:hypothetical protein